MGILDREMFKDEKQFRKFKKILRKHYSQGVPKEVRPLTEESRIGDFGGLYEECFTEYGFLRGTDYTDEELDEIREDMRLRVTSPYDCSGQHFTMWLTFHRNPSGLISYIHRIGTDI